jgi:hypothetical protein
MGFRTSSVLVFATNSRGWYSISSKLLLLIVEEGILLVTCLLYIRDSNTSYAKGFNAEKICGGSAY